VPDAEVRQLLDDVATTSDQADDRHACVGERALAVLCDDEELSSEIFDHSAIRPIRYTERLADAGIERSVGSAGDRTNALAESVIGLYKTEPIHRRGPWKGIDDVEFATLEWVAWYKSRRLLDPLG
jgi:putative transposase